MAAVLERLDEIEIGLCKRANRVGRRNAVRRLFATVSRLGDGAFWMVMALALIADQGIDGAHGVLRIALTGGICTLVYKTLKRRFVRERPLVSYLDIDCAVPPLDRYSFPSEHTLQRIGKINALREVCRIVAVDHTDAPAGAIGA